MKATVFNRYGQPDVLVSADVPTPVPEKDEVRIRVHAVAASTSDCGIRRGDSILGRLFMGIRRPKRPILGMELSGEVESVGEGVTRFAVGDEVYGASTAGGGFAEYICLAQDAALAIKPSNLSHAEAAAVCEGGLTALPFLRDKAKIRAGQRVLINGASGSVGTAAVQLAKHFGAEVTGVCSASSAELVRSLGADAVIDYRQEDFSRSDQTYDVIFDAVGKSSFSACKEALSPGGIYLTTVPSLAIIPQMLWTSRFGSKKAAIAFTALRAPGARCRDLVVLRGIAEAGGIKGVIGERYPLADAAEAHRYIETGHKKGSAVLEVGPILGDTHDDR